MPNLLPLYLYYRHREGVPVQEIAKSLGLSVETVALRLEAARLCLERQCIVDLI